MAEREFEAESDKLSNYIDLEQWAFILNRFSEVLGVDIYTVDLKGKIMTRPQHAPKGSKLIETPFQLVQRLLRKSAAANTLQEETGSLGITHSLIPILGEGTEPLAYLVVGPLVLGSRAPRAELERFARKEGWDLLELEGAYQQLKLFSFVGMKSMLDLLSEVCNYLVQPSPLKEKVEEAFSQLDNFFATLLDLALRTTKADSGSVMILDPQSKTLRIRAAHGLDKEVVRKTEIKLGEGIAGWVAKKNRSLLLGPDTTVEPDLQQCLKRPNIDSSIIMPLSRQDQVLGVLNINSYSEDNRLRAQSLDLLTQLAKLTMVMV